MFSVPPAAVAAMRQHAIREFPAESVGVLTDEGYVPCTNIYKERDPLDPGGEKFEIAAEEWAQIEHRALAIIHSHPMPYVKPSLASVMDRSYDGPSSADMASQIAMAIPYGIVVAKQIAENGQVLTFEPYFWGDSLPIAPLVGRGFRHGPSGTDGKGDCAAVLRDAYRLGAAALEPIGARNWPFPPLTYPESPRDDAWWLNRKPGYIENFEASGFKRIMVTRPTDLQVGDILLTQLMSNVPNHAMLYLGNSLILHHKPNRVSNVETAARWLAQSRFFIRRADRP